MDCFCKNGWGNSGNTGHIYNQIRIHTYIDIFCDSNYRWKLLSKNYEEIKYLSKIRYTACT